MKIKWGSLYTVVQNLEKHGFLAAVESTRQGGRPERTIYRITDAGRAELEDWVRELVASTEREQPRFEAALSVLGVLHPDEVDEPAPTAPGRGWRRRSPPSARRSPRAAARCLACSSSRGSSTWPSARPRCPGSGRCVAELTSGSLPGLEQWRAWHGTGQAPPEWADIAERGRTTD